MNPFWLILIMILAVMYIISPINLIPDVIPYIGRLDDIFIAFLTIYYLRYGRLPGFMSGLGRLLGIGRPPGGSGSGDAGERAQYRHDHDAAGGDPTLDPYAVLGVEPGASQAEIHSAYREAAQRFHPDKVSHLGEEFQVLAQKKFVEIQKAYEVLKNGKRG
jgi:hypothetical protein